MNMPLQIKCKFRTKHSKDNHTFSFYYYILATSMPTVSNTTKSLLLPAPTTGSRSRNGGQFCT